jgi:zinc D-Ala-D-Ala dipeptidase
MLVNMFKNIVNILLVLLSVLFLNAKAMALPKGFVYLEAIDASIIQDIRYFSANNFTGQPVPGYEAPRCILTQQTAVALSKVQQALRPLDLGLKVYDCYRPQQAVDHFIAWSQHPSDQKMKAEYYPRVDKADFFTSGYVAAKSGHTRGSTVDLTIIHLAEVGQDPVKVEMGTHFDFMDPDSYPLSTAVSAAAHQNRLFLRGLMQAAGFEPFETEWWHFTLKNEAFPDRYFNFPVK